MEHEVLFASHRIGVFVARDEYRFDSVVRTALIHGHGGKTVGFSHGDDTYPTPSTQNIAMDYFCYVGEFHRQLLHRGNASTGAAVVIGLGIYGLDDIFQFMRTGHVPGKYAEVARRFRIIGAFPTSFGRDFCITRTQIVSFYRAVLALEDLYDDVFIILRPKQARAESVDPEIRQLLSRSKGRVILEEEIASPEIIPLCDLIICMGGSTIGLEGLMAGKRVLYLDETGFREDPYRRYDDRLVAWTPEELLRNAEWVVAERTYVDPDILERLRADHGFRFDGMATERLRAVIRRALAESAWGHQGGQPWTKPLAELLAAPPQSTVSR